MNQNATFSYNYSAKVSKEVRDIREKYLPRKESKLDELKRLDRTVQNSGVAESLCTGIAGALIFGLGMCLAMQVTGSGWILIATGILLGIVGGAIMLAAYPVYRRVFEKTKKKHTPRILELTEGLIGEKNL